MVSGAIHGPMILQELFLPWQGIKNKVGNNVNLLYAKGCNINDTSHAGFSEAIETAMQADVVIMNVGEAADMEWRGKKPQQYSFARCTGRID